ncbi:probable serine carboxypeptidase CPVL [Aplysia californica]|uniref:Probable serine carboxypeptidase CPVL n=1 Tax=Aplysia californica TaxID=6500 RepID=A0ABM0ZW38_APLCA|nr:probable serine carboxypeptidase CPVL [Aplysia californica]
MEVLLGSGLLLLCTGASVWACGDPLMLTPILEAGDVDKAQNLSRVVMPALYNGTSHAGFLTANKTLGNHLFFWFFPSMEQEDAPLLVWLNGGPGISSMLGLFWENGPVEVDMDMAREGFIQSEPRQFSWVGPFSMLYIDNPVQVGFSYTESGDMGLRLNQEGYSEDLYSVMLQFYSLFPDYHNRELYIGGQSYAGKYVPALAHKIHVGNRDGNTHLPLAGIYLGGPYFAPEEENLAFYDFAFAMGFVSHATVVERKRDIAKVYEKVREGNNPEKESLATMMSLFWVHVGLQTKDNFVTQQRAGYGLLSDLMKIQEVRKALHVGNQTYNAQSYTVYEKFGGDLVVSTIPQMADLLDHYKVLIFTGDYDVIINSPMVEAGLQATPWSLREEYLNATRSIWMSSSLDLCGYFSLTGQFCRVVVHGAGHQVPHDQPQRAFQMITDFVRHGCIQPAH